MRGILAVAACLSIVALSGCVAEATGIGQDCTSSITQVVAQSKSVLLPAAATDGPPYSDATKIVVHARQGQNLQAVAMWTQDAGTAQVVFDGPAGHTTSVRTLWMSTAVGVPAGDYTLELEGTPVAFGVVYTMQLMAYGCTPV
jgi:hypothetical protein